MFAIFKEMMSKDQGFTKYSKDGEEILMVYQEDLFLGQLAEK
jgi:hypothetical protein